jgi:dTDP-4-amino-4,6-dideoxygalactose transaminase
LNVKKDDLILFQSSIFIATVNPILYQKAIPGFIDSEKDSWNICPILIETSIKDFFSQNVKLKAIGIGCSYGMPCN